MCRRSLNADIDVTKDNNIKRGVEEGEANAKNEFCTREYYKFRNPVKRKQKNYE